VRRLAASGRGLLAVAVMLWVGACSDAIVPPIESVSSCTVSDPVSDLPAPPGAIQASPPSSGADAAYIALPPGAIPGGSRAIIRNPRTASSVTMAMRDGGFDPGSVLAAPGDTLEIDVQDPGGMSLHPTARILYLGDTNVIEDVPQPFIGNLLAWGLR
jgi:hypothetical protein